MEISEITKALDMNSEYLGISRLVLMENAGKEISKECERFRSVAIFCGTGNNGGDGFVAARHLSGIGKRVKVYAIHGRRSREAEKNFEILKRLDSVEIRLIKDSADCREIGKELKEFDLVIDALIGTGVRGEVREPIKSLVNVINSSKAFRLCVDLPTPGVNPDLTISFHIPKTEGAKTVDIGIPREVESFCGPGDVYLSIPKRKGDEHKGDFGRLLVIGGSREFAGTPSLVAQSALRAGIDLVTIYCPAYVADRIPFDPNLIIKAMESEFYFSESDIDKIRDINFDAVVIGNGLGRKEETMYAVRKFLRSQEKPVILDADALKLIKLKDLRKNTIITPHAMEFKMLFGELSEKFEEQISLVQNFAEKTGAVILLKGRIDIISDGDKTKLNRTGNSGMTVGGTGDVLAGIIGALVANKSGLFQASCAGSFLCGLAGDIAKEDLGYYFTATDVIDRIPKAIKFCEGFV